MSQTEAQREELNCAHRWSLQPRTLRSWCLRAHPSLAITTGTRHRARSPNQTLFAKQPLCWMRGWGAASGLTHFRLIMKEGFKDILSFYPYPASIQPSRSQDAQKLAHSRAEFSAGHACCWRVAARHSRSSPNLQGLRQTNSLEQSSPESFSLTQTWETSLEWQSQPRAHRASAGGRAGMF